MVTARNPNEALYRALKARIEPGVGDVPRSLARVGDCEAPAIIAAAIFSGHRYARELDATVDPDKVAAFVGEAEAVGVPVTQIGRVVPDERAPIVLGSNGEPLALAGIGHTHF